MPKLNESEVLDIQEGRSVLVDVRSVDEFNTGHASYAINIPLDEINSIDIDTKKTLYVYCASGGRAQLAEMALANKGYKVINIGGIYDAIDIMGEA
jgi:phage shock protein E